MDPDLRQEDDILDDESAAALQPLRRSEGVSDLSVDDETLVT